MGVKWFLTYLKAASVATSSYSFTPPPAPSTPRVVINVDANSIAEPPEYDPPTYEQSQWEASTPVMQPAWPPRTQQETPTSAFHHLAKPAAADLPPAYQPPRHPPLQWRILAPIYGLVPQWDQPRHTMEMVHKRLMRETGGSMPTYLYPEERIVTKDWCDSDIVKANTAEYDILHAFGLQCRLHPQTRTKVINQRMAKTTYLTVLAMNPTAQHLKMENWYFRIPSYFTSYLDFHCWNCRNKQPCDIEGHPMSQFYHTRGDIEYQRRVGPNEAHFDPTYGRNYLYFCTLWTRFTVDFLPLDEWQWRQIHYDSFNAPTRRYMSGLPRELPEDFIFPRPVECNLPDYPWHPQNGQEVWDPWYDQRQERKAQDTLQYQKEAEGYPLVEAILFAQRAMREKKGTTR